MSPSSITDQRHNDYVGGDASMGRIPGADKATTGHQYDAMFPKEGQPQKSGGVLRPQEHLPPPTGRDAPPGTVPPLGRNVLDVLPADCAQFTERLTTRPRDPPSPPPHIPKVPLPPAPDSRTVIDRSPFATPATAGDTLNGATSQDVYRGYGHPGSGMTSAEQRHDGQKHRKRAGQGVATYGSGEIPREEPGDSEL
ncbi:hypothetical protein B0H21DRAFT_712129 [Amylocystis lapponica]|nr:hypothetical protein B0H21DRAFT_712129 [Amylocystis lapponica]